MVQDESGLVEEVELEEFVILPVVEVVEEIGHAIKFGEGHLQPLGLVLRLFHGLAVVEEFWE